MQQWSLKVCSSCPLYTVYKTFILKTCGPWFPFLCLPDILLCFWSFPHCQAGRAGHPLCHSGHWSLRICLCAPVRKYRWVAHSFCTISCKEKGPGKQPPEGDKSGGSSWIKALVGWHPLLQMDVCQSEVKAEGGNKVRPGSLASSVQVRMWPVRVLWGELLFGVTISFALRAPSLTA